MISSKWLNSKDEHVFILNLCHESYQFRPFFFSNWLYISSNLFPLCFRQKQVKEYCQCRYPSKDEHQITKWYRLCRERNVIDTTTPFTDSAMLDAWPPILVENIADEYNKVIGGSEPIEKEHICAHSHHTLPLPTWVYGLISQETWKPDQLRPMKWTCQLNQKQQGHINKFFNISFFQF